MPEDPPLQFVQFRPWLQAKLLDKSLARRLVRLERVGLPPGAIQGEHQHHEQPLAQRMLSDELLELGDKLCAAAHHEFRFDPRLHRAQPQFLQPRASQLRERLVEQVGPVPIRATARARRQRRRRSTVVPSF